MKSTLQCSLISIAVALGNFFSTITVTFFISKNKSKKKSPLACNFSFPTVFFFLKVADFPVKNNGNKSYAEIPVWWPNWLSRDLQ